MPTELLTIYYNGHFTQMCYPEQIEDTLNKYGLPLEDIDIIQYPNNAVVAPFNVGDDLQLHILQEVTPSQAVPATATLAPNTFTAVAAGVIGNSISLVFDGTDVIAVTNTWNIANPDNLVSFTGDGTSIHPDGTLALSRGVDAVSPPVTFSTVLKDVLNTADGKLFSALIKKNNKKLLDAGLAIVTVEPTADETQAVTYYTLVATVPPVALLKKGTVVKDYKAGWLDKINPMLWEKRK